MIVQHVHFVHIVVVKIVITLHIVIVSIGLFRRRIIRLVRLLVVIIYWSFISAGCLLVVGRCRLSGWRSWWLISIILISIVVTLRVALWVTC